jgi:O-antigen/teichoic acid export membrane protein
MTIGWALLNRSAGSIARFVMSLLVARALGAEGAGIFFLFIAWMNFLGVLGSLGLPTYTLRSVSVLEDGDGDHPESHRFVSAALKVALVGGALMVALVLLSSGFLADRFLPSPDLVYIIRIAAIAGCGMVILNIFTQALTGRGQIVAAMHFETTLIALVVVAFISITILLGKQSTPELTIIVYLVAVLATIVLARWSWLRRVRRGPRGEAAAGPVQLLPKEMATFWSTGIATVVANNVAILVLPLFASPADIGLFGIAHRMATMSVTILDALGNVFGPAFARHYARKNAAGLRRELLRSQFYSLLAFVPFVLVFVFFAAQILGVVGEDFVAARQLLLILVVGQLVNSATGLPGILLNMSHRQHLNLYVALGQTLLTVALIFVLGPQYGGVGIAIAVSAAVAIKNLVFYGLAHLSIARDAKNWETREPIAIPEESGAA